MHPLLLIDDTWRSLADIHFVSEPGLLRLRDLQRSKLHGKGASPSKIYLEVLSLVRRAKGLCIVFAHSRNSPS